jgi:phosphosulfolactate synthase (CoM biosynthesis protein A)|tara:strand:- start:40 stop:468 length:429 start_codon:yes stop_codon:yes gene_type:complete
MNKLTYLSILLFSTIVTAQEIVLSNGLTINKKEIVTITFTDVTKDILYQNMDQGLEIVYIPKGKLELTNKEYKRFVKDAKEAGEYKSETLYEEGEKYGKLSTKNISRDKYEIDSWSFINHAIYFSNPKVETGELLLKDIYKL